VRDLLGSLLRCLTILIAVVLIIGIIGGALWLLLKNQPVAPLSERPTISGKSLEQTGLALYLRFRQNEITESASNDPTVVNFRIEPGETAATIGPRLQNLGLIRDGQLFRLLVRYLGVDDKLEAGDYKLRRNMSLEEIVTVLQHGVTRARKVTIPEGWRMEQAAQLLAREGLVDEGQFLELARAAKFDYAFLNDRPAGRSLEGYLFPDTYQVDEGTDTRGVIELLLRSFDRRVTPAMRQRAAEIKMTLYEVVTLASIVEREAVVEEERNIIASVYHNRLAKGMYLQADPTVQYAKGFNPQTGRWWNPMLLEEAQAVTSPYNTFLHAGLPPGPICSPGVASIRAVLYPADTKYLFFHSKGDGSHAFAETYEEHLANMQKYQR